MSAGICGRLGKFGGNSPPWRRRMTIRVDLYTKVVLTAAVLLLGALAVQPLLNPAAVRAEAEAASLYIEPGLTRIPGPNLGPDTMGKLVIDLKTGDAWGFPTIFTNYREPAISKPIYVGRMDFAAMKRPH
jgi:hypothetical protein